MIAITIMIIAAVATIILFIRVNKTLGVGYYDHCYINGKLVTLQELEKENASKNKYSFKFIIN